MQRDAGGDFDLPAHALDDRLDTPELLCVAYLGDHDLRMHVDAFLDALCRCLENRLHLHLVDARMGDAQPHAPVAEHRIHLGERVHLAQHRLTFGQEVIVPTRRAVAREAFPEPHHAFHLLAREVRVEEPERVRQLLRIASCAADGAGG